MPKYYNIERFLNYPMRETQWYSTQSVKIIMKVYEIRILNCQMMNKDENLNSHILFSFDNCQER